MGVFGLTGGSCGRKLQAAERHIGPLWQAVAGMLPATPPRVLQLLRDIGETGESRGRSVLLRGTGLPLPSACEQEQRSGEQLLWAPQPTSSRLPFSRRQAGAGVSTVRLGQT